VKEKNIMIEGIIILIAWIVVVWIITDILDELRII
tara:strand:+ start:3534 stop:3638 length:105 start_codon:yes stop_codon:yes gene_type:complete